MNNTNVINDVRKKYEELHLKKNPAYVYPNEFVIRIFLGNSDSYPNKHLKSLFSKNFKILDLSFGDGRNTILLCQLGLDVYGTEISKEIVQKTLARMNQFGFNPEFAVGKNSSLPYNSSFFDCILAVNSCYYLDNQESLDDNLKNIFSKIKNDGYFVASLPAVSDSEIFRDSELCKDGSRIIKNDPLNIRIGYRLFGFKSEEQIKKIFSNYAYDISIGVQQSNYFGLKEKLFWLVCRKKPA
jgi:SAM-dependent methyltransferase